MGAFDADLRARGRLKPDPRAVAMFRRAATQGHLPSLVNLAGSYREGYGVAKDAGMAARLARLGAELGDATSMLGLSDAYAFALGVARDPVEAYHWLALTLASEHFNPHVPYPASYVIPVADLRHKLHLLAETMTPAEVREAEARAALWRPKTWAEIARLMPD